MITEGTPGDYDEQMRICYQSIVAYCGFAEYGGPVDYNPDAPGDPKELMRNFMVQVILAYCGVFEYSGGLVGLSAAPQQTPKCRYEICRSK